MMDYDRVDAIVKAAFEMNVDEFDAKNDFEKYLFNTIRIEANNLRLQEIKYRLNLLNRFGKSS